MTRLPDYFRIALVNLSHRRTRAYLTMIGIFIGIAAVVSLISLGQGLKDAIGQQFSSVGTDKILVTPGSLGFGPPGAGAVSNLTNKDLRLVQNTIGIKIAVGRLLRSVKVESDKKTAFVFATSMPSQNDQRRLIIDLLGVGTASGRMIEQGDSFKVTVGSDFATKKTFGREIKVGDKITINDVKFEVVGILERTGRPTGDNFVIMNEKILRDLLDVQDNYDMIAAQVQTNADVEAVVQTLEKDLRKSRNVKEGKEDFKVQSSTSFLASLDVILTMVQIVLVGIAAISLVVGGIGIMNTMYTAVLERTKEIGLMKAIGGTNTDILFIFVLEAGLLGTVGGLIGVLLGMGLAKLVELAAFAAFGKGLIQASFPIYLIAGALLFSFVIGSLSGLWPALQASRLKPVDALRYE